ncbi:MAG TPA: CBS domain-containing protein [Noviherbaspirillum sp.]|jgi:CBS domain-containing protein|uniref:CBS domain-containing protein n=1 Tax=Noviherbaspirillum sp. TaxID=1926288 RepID=UPI002F93E10E
MRASDAMTRDVQVIGPDETIVDAARLMADCDCGVLPVGENDRLVGMITDRDIVVRALAREMGGTTRVRDVMSTDVKYCFEDDDLDEVAANMGELQVRRLPVVSRDKRLVGILSLGDVSHSADIDSTGAALAGVSESTSQHHSSGMRPH